MIGEALSAHQWVVFSIFIVGYLCIVFEHVIKVNKTTTALLMASFCWIAHFLGPIPFFEDLRVFSKGLAETSEVVFFLLGALAIVESIHAHGSLNLICSLMRVSSKKAALWLVAIVSFFLSSVLDNLTSTVVMVVLLRKLVHDYEDRIVFGSVVVMAANAGGVWTPMGDVTTTMLWVKGKVTSGGVVQSLFFPSLACLVGSVAVAGRSINGVLQRPEDCSFEVQPHAKEVLIFGLLALVAVPVLKCTTGLPPFLGILTALSSVWLFTDYIHRGHPDRSKLHMTAVFPYIDIVSLLFFLGILLAVNVLQVAGILTYLANSIDAVVATKEAMAILMGLLSAVVDNVPLVAAAMGMYDLSVYPVDSCFWKLIAYCAGTGGSILIIGSAAGIAFMGLERVKFFWYVRKASLAALCGYFTGIGFYLVQQSIFGGV